MVIWNSLLTSSLSHFPDSLPYITVTYNMTFKKLKLFSTFVCHYKYVLFFYFLSLTFNRLIIGNCDIIISRYETNCTLFI